MDLSMAKMANKGDRPPAINTKTDYAGWAKAQSKDFAQAKGQDLLRINYSSYKREWQDQPAKQHDKPTKGELEVRAGNDQSLYRQMNNNPEAMKQVSTGVKHLWEQNNKNNSFPKNGENKWEDKNNYLNTRQVNKQDPADKLANKREVAQQSMYKKGSEAIAYKETYLKSLSNDELKTRKQENEQSIKENGGKQNIEKNMNFTQKIQERRKQEQAQKQTQKQDGLNQTQKVEQKVKQSRSFKQRM